MRLVLLRPAQVHGVFAMPAIFSGDVPASIAAGARDGNLSVPRDPARPFAWRPSRPPPGCAASGSINVCRAGIACEKASPRAKRTGEQVTDPTEPHPVSQASAPPASAPQASAPQASAPHGWSPAAALRALTWWLGGMSLGGMVFGMYGAQRPFGDGMITHPLFVYCGLALVGLLILRFAGDRPLLSDRALAAGVAMGLASYALGWWFGASLVVR